MENSVVILLRLLFAHIVGDFILQPSGMVQKKQQKKAFSHVVHALVQALLAYLAVGQWNQWQVPLIIFSTHWLIDYWKICRSQGLRTFLTDQGLHLLVIAILWMWITPERWSAMQWFTASSAQPTFWIIATAILLLLKPTSVFLALFTRRWRSESNNSHSSLQNAGQWIGYLERLLILLFILTRWPEGIGFLLAAKSIFRFGELNKAKDIKTTEYVLIGTFASFLIAVTIGVIARLLCPVAY